MVAKLQDAIIYKYRKTNELRNFFVLKTLSFYFYSDHLLLLLALIIYVDCYLQN